MMKRTILYILFLVFFFDPIGQAKQIDFRTLTMADGLSSNDIFSITQDNIGYMWIATRDGISYFDGYDFYPYNDPQLSIPITDVMVLYSYSTDVYVGTCFGLYRIDTITMKSHIVKGTEGSFIRAILIDDSGNMWLGTIKGLLVLKSDGTIVNIKGLHTTIHEIKQAKDGSIWIASHTGLYSISSIDQKVTLHPFSEKNGTTYSLVTSLSFISDNELLLGTENGILIFNLSTNKFSSLNTINIPKGKDVIKDILYTPELLWAATDYGLYVYDYESCSPNVYYHEFNNYNSLPTNVIEQIYKDKDGLIWLVSRNGLTIADFSSTYSNSYPVIYEYDDHIIKCSIRDITMDSHGHLWGATEQGIFYSNMKDDIIKLSDDGINSKLRMRSTTSVEEDYLGNMWIGSAGGILIYNPSTGYYREINSSTNNSLSGDFVGKIRRSENRMYVSFWSNYMFEFTQDKSTNINYYRPVAEATDKFVILDNKVYFIMSNKFYFSDGTWPHDYIDTFQIQVSQPYLKNQIVYSITTDGIRRIYIGITGAILSYDIINNKIDVIDLAEPNDPVINIEYLKDDKLIATTDRTLIEIDGDLIHKVYTLTDRSLIQNFNKDCILLANENDLFIGGDGGLIKYNIANYEKPIEIKKELIISSFSNDKDNGIFKDNCIKLNHPSNNFSLTLSTLDFLNSQQYSYKYYLEGYDKEWKKNIAGDNLIQYHGIPIGKYTLKILAEDYNGKECSPIKEIELVVKPPIGLSNGFIFLYITTLIFLSFIVNSLLRKRRKIKRKNLIEKLNTEHKQKEIEEKIKLYHTISHEICTPLSLIQSPLKQLSQRNDLSSKAYSLVTLAKDNTDRMFKLVTRLLDFNNTYNTQADIKYQKSDLIAFLRKIFYRFEDISCKTGINYTFSTSENELEVFFDEEKLETVLYNLLSNAFKYNTSEKGFVKLEINLEENNIIKISVVDNGIGLSDETRKHLFANYYRGKEAVDNNIEGTGIGLPETKRLVELMEGSVNVVVTSNKETAFIVRLPAKLSINDNNEENKIVISGKNPDYYMKWYDTKRSLVLLVEDNLDLIEHIASTLSETYSIITAQNGQKGYELAVKYQPNIIISDVVMPIMDGLEMCNKIKQDPNLKLTPIIFLTARIQEVDKLEGIRSGCDSYLTKPFDMDLLEANVNQLLTKRTEMIEFMKSNMIIGNVDYETMESEDKIFINKILRLTEKHLTEENFNVTKLCSYIGISRGHLNRKIKNLTGLTTIEFMKKYRLHKAASMIQTNTGNISEIMYAVGFQSTSYFARCFKNEFGVLPHEF